MKKVDISKKYNLDSVQKGWNKYDQMWVLDKLENTSRGGLIKLCELPQIRIRFGDNWEGVPTDEMIGALFHDFPADILVPAIVSVMYEGK